MTMQNTIDTDDPFRYDPIGNFKKLGHAQQWHAICVQKQLVDMLYRERRRVEALYLKKRERELAEREAGTIYETRGELFDAYITGEISDEVYQQQLECIRKAMPSHWQTTDWMTWLEIFEKEQRLILADMKEIHKNTKQNKLPKTYGYDPRRPSRKYNYPRTDWGKTRENIYDHLRKRGVNKKR